MASPRLSYIICTNPRSGSWLLADGLRDTAAAGFPREWFQDEEEAAYSRQWNIACPSTHASYEQYLDKVLQAGTKNGVFGMKCMHYQFAAMPAKLKAIPRFRDLAIADILPQAFPNLRYIWLIRRDKVQQAISYHRANQTQVWWHVENAAPGDSSPAVYDPQSIERHEKLLLQAEAGWKEYFAQCPQKPLIIYYEDFIKNFQETIYQVLAYIGVENPRSIAVPPPRHQKMADASAGEWAERYLAYKKDKAATPAVIQPRADTYITTAAAPVTDAVTAAILPKRQSFTVIQRQLAGYDPKHGRIERRENLSRNEFLEQYYATNRPVILTGIMNGWSAMTRWTPDYLKATCGDAMVEIMADRNRNPAYETEEAKHRRTVRLGDFIDMVEQGGATNDYYLTARNEFFKNPVIAPLLRDIVIFPEYLDSSHFWMFLWYGPKDTVTPLHHDLMNIFMAQVKGRKRIHLVPAGEMDLVYNSVGVYSPVDPERPDYEKFPRFRDATLISLELAPGEVLFLPVGWWHHVRSLDTSITVTLMNFLWGNRFEWVNPEAARHG